MWTIAYKPVTGAVFDVVATWADDKQPDKTPVSVSISVNFEADGSVDDLIARCKKALEKAHAADEVRTKYAQVFEKLEAQLNGA